MKIKFLMDRVARLALVPLLLTAVGTAVAQGPPGHGDRGDGRDPQDNRGGRDNNNQRDNNRRDGGQDFRFRDQDRGNFQTHYSKDVARWQRSPQGRPQFARGQKVPSNYRFQTVPQSYYQNAPPPPPGYRYGYYDGYVVAYNPTTRIVADVLDLVAAATR